MNRRSFLAIAAGILAAPLPAPVRAQQSSKVYHVGWLYYGQPGESASRVRALRMGLQDHGYVEGKNIALLRWLQENRKGIENRLAESLGDKKLLVMIDDLDRGDIQLVPQLLLALREVFDLRQCVFILALDPVVVAEGLPEVHPGWGRSRLKSWSG